MCDQFSRDYVNVSYSTKKFVENADWHAVLIIIIIIINEYYLGAVKSKNC